MRISFRPIVALAVGGYAALALAACNRNRPTDTPAPTTAPAAGDDVAERARRDSIAREEAARAERERRAREEATRAEAERVRALLEAPVYFEFDQSDLDTDARATLTAKLAELNRDGTLTLRIMGHADERGSDEYNMALGLRRAAAARRFLTQRGIDEGRLALHSAGEEQPVCTESEESCWSRNRRATFEVTGGGAMATRD